MYGFQGWLETAADDEVLRSNPPQRIVAEPDHKPVVVGGRRIGVFANINAPSEAALGATLGADGVGLLRTEFLYIDRREPPTLAQESAAYRAVAKAFAGRPIVVRTLDLGGDKPGAGFAADGADHGMLGIRGIRLTPRHPELFARHLHAAGDAALTDLWVDAGVDKLSVAPGLVPWLKATVRTRLWKTQKE